MNRRATLGSIALLLGTPHLARGAGIIAVRVWPANEYTRVTIESDAPLAARHALHDKPPRLSVDIEGLELSLALRQLVGKVRADDPFIANMRIGQFKPRVTRLVLDLKQPTAPQLFTLAPVAAYQHRLVFDLYPTVAPDPLLALILEKEKGERAAAAAVRDALGDLVGQPGKPVPAAPEVPSPSVPLPPSPMASAQLRDKVERLVIVALDPGHGGEDPGGIGPSGVKEKDIALAVALALRKRLNQQPGMRAMLTRDADYFVPLAERVRKARRVQADLFVRSTPTRSSAPRRAERRCSR